MKIIEKRTTVQSKSAHTLSVPRPTALYLWNFSQNLPDSPQGEEVFSLPDDTTQLAHASPKFHDFALWPLQEWWRQVAHGRACSHSSSRRRSSRRVGWVRPPPPHLEPPARRSRLPFRTGWAPVAHPWDPAASLDPCCSPQWWPTVRVPAEKWAKVLKDLHYCLSW